MLARLFAVSFLFVFSYQMSVSYSANTKKRPSYGQELTLTIKTQFSTLLNNPDSYRDKIVLTSARVEKVCQKKGCWMGLRNKNQKLRVVFRDYGFFVPTDIIGKNGSIPTCEK